MDMFGEMFIERIELVVICVRIIQDQDHLPFCTNISISGNASRCSTRDEADHGPDHNCSEI